MLVAVLNLIISSNLLAVAGLVTDPGSRHACPIRLVASRPDMNVSDGRHAHVPHT